MSSAQTYTHGIAVDFDVGGSVDKAALLLAGIPGGIQKAVASATKRAVQGGSTAAAKEVSKRYRLSAAKFAQYTRLQWQADNQGSGVIKFSGPRIPLIDFDAVITGERHYWRVRVKRESKGDVLTRAFLLRGNIWQRVGKPRLPIESLTGPATPQMLVNTEVESGIGEHMRDVFERRLDHEVTALLNGWRA